MEGAGLETRQRGEFDEVDVAVGIVIRMVDRHLARKVPPNHFAGFLNFLDQRGFVVIDERNDAAHGSLQADMPHESARVDV